MVISCRPANRYRSHFICVVILWSSIYAGCCEANEYKLSIDLSNFRLNGDYSRTPTCTDHGTLTRSVSLAAAPSPLSGKPYASEIQDIALETGIDAALIHAVISVESAYNPAARSPAGAVGLMQVMPATAARYGITDPSESMLANLRAGAMYLRDLLLQFDHNLTLVLAAYNAGENAVRRHGHRIPPYHETQRYVPAVLAKYHEWQDPKTLSKPPSTSASGDGSYRCRRSPAHLIDSATMLRRSSPAATDERRVLAVD